MRTKQTGQKTKHRISKEGFHRFHIRHYVIGPDKKTVRNNQLKQMRLIKLLNPTTMR